MDDTNEELCEQLHTLDQSLAFLVLLILSICLSWKATAIQRQGLCDILCQRAEKMPDVFPIRLVASAIVVGSLVFFFGLSLDTLQESQYQDQIAQCSAQRNVWASLFVLAAALIRLYDQVWVQQRQSSLEGTALPE